MFMVGRGQDASTLFFHTVRMSTQRSPRSRLAKNLHTKADGVYENVRRRLLRFPDDQGSPGLISVPNKYRMPHESD